MEGPILRYFDYFFVGVGGIVIGGIIGGTHSYVFASTFIVLKLKLRKCGLFLIGVGCLILPIHPTGGLLVCLLGTAIIAW